MLAIAEDLYNTANLAKISAVMAEKTDPGFPLLLGAHIVPGNKAWWKFPFTKYQLIIIPSHDC
jgi:hypothetical protein